MVNVFFSESTYCSLKEIDAYKSEQNILIRFFLSYGTLSDNLYSSERKNIISELFGGVYDELFKSSLENLKSIEELPPQTDICIWYSDFDPNDLISLYFLCHILLGKNFNIFVQRFPSSIYKNMQGWWSMGLDLLSEMQDNKRLLPKSEINCFDHKWNEILENNSQLRISKNGEIMHVEEDYYDNLILKAKSKTVEEDKISWLVFEQTDDCLDSYWIINRSKKIV